ncbi:MAG: geranylgeranyl reductase family protein [Bacteroidia bacterium]|jgi:geranylgeranyl reductase family protein|nr:geranylgeranyl reductase family protein [Bacteroidota bacterium]MBP6511125.1 geranylgeranyl reductase family protein [Bacteroidia bacterium]MBP7244475.1 geranylgeranyl reductase family protein [Bacteroidia bacterium]
MLYFSKVEYHPIIIIGAGPAGSTTALALAKKGISCLLLDQSEFPRDKVCGDALSGKVLLTLKRIDPLLVEGLATQEHTLDSHGVTFVAPNGKVLKVPFRREENKEKPPGYISRRYDFDNWLFNNAKNAKGVQTKLNVRIEKFRRDGKDWIISDKEEKHVYRTSLLIAADGAHSRFAKEVGGIQMEDEHYCAGLRAYYKGVKDLDPNGYIELHFVKDFLPGYFWIFPLPNGYANVGVGMRSDVVSKKKVNLKEDMLRLIREYEPIRSRFEGAELEGPIRGYGLPLGSKKRPLSGDGFILLGDAGSLIDPFTGEGIGNAMISGLKAAETIETLNGNYSAAALQMYDDSVYKRLWPELSLSKKMQELVKYPWLFNLVVNKAVRSKTLRETISCMFEDIDLRGRLKDPKFYLKVLME